MGLYWSQVNIMYTHQGGDKVDKEQIGSRLKTLRGSRSQQEVAQAVGVTPMAISLYESGERIPRDEIKVKLAEYFKTTINAIFFA